MNINVVGTYLCGVCITVMERMSEISGLSYGLINVLFFIVLQPLSIFSFFMSIVSAWLYCKTRRKFFKYLALACVIIGTLAILAVLVPVTYVFFCEEF